MARLAGIVTDLSGRIRGFARQAREFYESAIETIGAAGAQAYQLAVGSLNALWDSKPVIHPRWNDANTLVSFEVAARNAARRFTEELFAGGPDTAVIPLSNRLPADHVSLNAEFELLMPGMELRTFYISMMQNGIPTAEDIRERVQEVLDRIHEVYEFEHGADISTLPIRVTRIEAGARH